MLVARDLSISRLTLLPPRPDPPCPVSSCFYPDFTCRLPVLTDGQEDKAIDPCAWLAGWSRRRGNGANWPQARQERYIWKNKGKRLTPNPSERSVSTFHAPSTDRSHRPTPTSQAWLLASARSQHSLAGCPLPLFRLGQGLPEACCSNNA